METAIPPAPGRRAWQGWLPAAAILLATVLAYLPALFNGWIWDDPQYVTQNPVLREPSGLRDLWLRPTSTPQYYPVVFTTFWVEHALWGLRPLGYHLVNVLLHAANALLLWRVLRRLEVPGAWLAGMLFAVHPVHVESVAWVTERKNVLSGLFYLLALLSWLRVAGLAGEGGRGSRRAWAASLAFFALALLSKSVTATLPALALVLVWWKRGRIGRGDLLPLLPFFALGIASGLHTAWLEVVHVGAEGEEWALGPADRVVLAGRALWFYAGKLAFPTDLMFIYPRWEVDAGAAWQWLFPAAALGVLAALLALGRRIGRGPLAAALAFSGTLFPALGFLNVFPFRYSFVADHFQYHASAALLALLGAGLARAAGLAGAAVRGAGIAGASLLLGSLAAMTALQCRMYGDEETLWRETLDRNPGAWIAWNNLGHLMVMRGERAAAEPLFRRSVEIHPRNHEAWGNLATCRLEARDPDGALACCRRALSIMPASVMARTVMGDALAGKGDIRGALDAYRAAGALKPDYFPARMNPVQVLEQSGMLDEAIAECRRAMVDFPREPRFPAKLGYLLFETGDPGAAVAVLEAAALAHPKAAWIRQTLGEVLFRTGRADRSVRVLREAASLAPASGEIHGNLAVALRALGRDREAEEEFREAIRLDPKAAAPRTNLARLLQEGGRPAEAEAVLREGIARSPGATALRSLLGATLASEGKAAEAVSVYREALAADPEDVPALTGLAWILATSRDDALRDPDGALEAAELMAAKAGRTDPFVLDTLAASFAAVGRFEEALRTVEEAARLEAARRDPALLEGLGRRHASYLEGKAWRE